MQNLLNITETAKFLGISISSIYRLTSQKKISFYKIGSRNLFSEFQIQQFLNTQQVGENG